MNEIIDEIPRYKKKSKKKPPQKSDHKHIYESCIFEYPRDWYLKSHIQREERNVTIGSYCPVCGKVGNFQINWFDDRMSEEIEMEMNPETRTLPTFWCENGPFQKFVDINRA